jgi:hypothetical protein
MLFTTAPAEKGEEIGRENRSIVAGPAIAGQERRELCDLREVPGILRIRPIRSTPTPANQAKLTDRPGQSAFQHLTFRRFLPMRETPVAPNNPNNPRSLFFADVAPAKTQRRSKEIAVLSSPKTVPQTSGQG